MRKWVAGGILAVLLIGTVSPGLADPMQLIIDSDTMSVSDAADIPGILSTRLRIVADKGYPHAECVLSAYYRENGEDRFIYHLSGGDFVQIDSVIYGDYSMSEAAYLNYLAGYPGIGVPFSYSAAEKAVRLLNHTPALIHCAQPEIEGRTLVLPVKKTEKAGLDGVMSYKNEGKARVFGELWLHLENISRLGRILEFRWQHPDESGHYIFGRAEEKFPFSLPLSLSGEFSQEFRDSSYVRRRWQADLSHYLRPGLQIGVHVFQEEISTNQSEATLDYTQESYSGSGIRAFWSQMGERLDWRTRLNADVSKSNVRTLYAADFFSQLNIRKGSGFGALSLRAAGLKSAGQIPACFRMTTASADFLQAEDPELTRSLSYGGATLGGGFRNASSRVELFVELVRFFDRHEQIVNGGVAMTVPAASRKVTLILAFNPERSWSAGKLHIVWEL